MIQEDSSQVSPNTDNSWCAQKELQQKQQHKSGCHYKSIRTLDQFAFSLNLTGLSNGDIAESINYVVVVVVVAYEAKTTTKSGQICISFVLDWNHSNGDETEKTDMYFFFRHKMLKNEWASDLIDIY